MDTPLEAALRFKRSGDRLENSNQAAVRTAALFVQKTIELRSPKDLRNARKRGNGATRGAPVKLTVWISKTAGALLGGGSARMVAGRGPWRLIEFDTSAHLIGTGRRKETLAKAIGGTRRGYLRFGDGNVRLGPIAHPGTKGQHVFREGWTAAAPVVPKIIDAEVKKSLYQTFGF